MTDQAMKMSTNDMNEPLTKGSGTQHDIAETNISTSGLGEQLPTDAQNIFRAAMESATRDGMSEDAAREVAWTTIKADYETGSDGQWHRKERADEGIHYKPSQSGGN